MKRQVLLLDVTDMAGDAVCIAGMDLQTLKTVRLADRTPTRRLLNMLGGLPPGQIIEVDYEQTRTGGAPHTEDARWSHLKLRKVRVAPQNEIVSLIDGEAVRTVEGAFGPCAFKSHRGNSAWTPGCGDRSLATLRVQAIRLYLEGDSLRAKFTDAGGAHWPGVPFQDLSVKTHPACCDGCKTRYLRNTQEEFDADDALIRIGLTRPFAPGAGSASGCWLQVTNILARPRAHFV